MTSLRPLSARRYGKAALRRLRDVATGPVPELERPRDMSVRRERFTGARLVAGLTERLDFWWLDDVTGGVLRVAVRAEDALNLLSAVLDVAREESLAVTIRHRRTNAALENTTRNASRILAKDRLVRLVLDDARSLHPPLTVLVEGWTSTPEGHLQAPQNNSVVSRLWNSTLTSSPVLGATFNMRDVLAGPPTEDVDFDIDWVFSWVDGTDPHWQEMFAEWSPEETTDATDRSRYVTRDDLRFALRSLETYAPWIRRIYVLTNCRPPAWLDLTDERIVWVDHTEVFDAEHLPTFSSHAIETVVHRIPGLSEHFVYSNDDFFLLRPTTKADFFYANGIARLRLENYGMVNGAVADGEPDYLNGARNSAALLREDFAKVPVRLHTHSPQSMNRTVLAEMEERYTDAFKTTRANKFRHSTDIAVTGFLYHHYAFLTGRAVPDGASTLLVQQNHKYGTIFEQLLTSVRTGQRARHLSVCVNDGRGSHDNADWDAQAKDFLNNYFPVKSRYER